MTTVAPFFDSTILLTYDVTNKGKTADGLGRLNRANVGSSNQKFKGNLGVNWMYNITTANFILRYVSGYD